MFNERVECFMGTIYHPGYAGWKFDKRHMANILDNLVPNLPQAADTLKADCLIVHGTSGVWMAGLLVMLQDLPVVLVRKPGENSHGYEVEGPNGTFSRGIVIDDTVCSGRTINRIQHILDGQRSGLSVVGVAVYLDGYVEREVWVTSICGPSRYVPIRRMAEDFPGVECDDSVRVSESRNDCARKMDWIPPNEPAFYEASIKKMPAYGSNVPPSKLLQGMINRL